MASFSLNSHHKIFHSLLIAVISILIFVIIADAAISFFLHQYLDEISLNLKGNLGLDLSFHNVYFDFFYGILINGLAIAKEGNRILDLRSIRLNLNFLKIILKRELSYKNIYIQDLHIYKTDYFNKYYLPFLFSNIKINQDSIKSTMIKLDDMNIMDSVSLDLDGYVALASNKLLLTRGKIRIKQAVFLENSKVGFINSLLNEPLNYAFEAAFTENDFLINRLDLAGHSARLLLSAKVLDFDSSMTFELNGELKNLLLEDIRLFNNEYLRTNGILEAIFSINGPLENLNFSTKINLINCNLNILNALNIKRINSNLVWDKQGLRSENISGLIGDAPVNLNLKIDKLDTTNKINLELSSQKSGLFDQAHINLQGDFTGGVLKGDANITFDYTRVQKKSIASFIFRNFYLNLYGLYFKSEIVDISLNESTDRNSDKIFKKIEATKLSGNLAITQNSFTIDNMRAEIYNGICKGSVSFGAKENAVSFKSRINLYDLETKDIAREFLSKEYRLSGKLSGAITINSEASENITGEIQIVNGKIENNAVLTAISDFFSVPSLKTVDFSNFRILFRKIWDKYEAQINLYSKDIWVYLDNKFFIDGTMDGYLLAKLTTKLMDESKRFRKLFKYIEYKEPTVYFPFKLKGFVDKPRIEWLSNEFKEKLQGFLSQSNQKLLQRELNKLVEKFVR